MHRRGRERADMRSTDRGRRHAADEHGRDARWPDDTGMAGRVTDAGYWWHGSSLLSLSQFVRQLIRTSWAEIAQLTPPLTSACAVPSSL